MGEPVDDDDLPYCVLTFRKTSGGVEVWDAIVQHDEMDAHDVASALCRTGQPTWLLSPWEMWRSRYRSEDLDLVPNVPASGNNDPSGGDDG